MTTYKVWVHVEEIDEEEDRFQDIGLPVDVAEFDSLQEADDYAKWLGEPYLMGFVETIARMYLPEERPAAVPDGDEVLPRLIREARALTGTGPGAA